MTYSLAGKGERSLFTSQLRALRPHLPFKTNCNIRSVSSSFPPLRLFPSSFQLYQLTTKNQIAVKAPSQNPTMPSTTEDCILLWALLSQKTDANGNLPGIDWQKVADALSLDRVNTAQVRFTVLKKKLRETGLDVPEKTGAGKASTSKDSSSKVTTKKSKHANPKARAAVTKKKGKGKSIGAKNNKNEMTEEDDGDNDEMHMNHGHAVKEEAADFTEENDGKGYQELSYKEDLRKIIEDYDDYA